MEELNALINLDRELNKFITQIETHPEFKYFGWVKNSLIKIRLKGLEKMNIIEDRKKEVVVPVE
jgi:hypothetical protein